MLSGIDEIIFKTSAVQLMHDWSRLDELGLCSDKTVIGTGDQSRGVGVPPSSSSDVCVEDLSLAGETPWS